jgi:hypothetical protein
MTRPLPITLLLFFFCGCPSKEEAKKDQPAPPPLSSAGAQAGACAGGGGTVADPVSAAWFPRSVGGYCVDPQGETKTYGENAKHAKEEICTTLFDGECEIYIRYKLTHVVALRYVDGAGKGGTVDVIVSTYADPGGAYGMYTKRVIADSDPADESAPKPIKAGASAVMGTGRAYAWKGSEIVELQYNNEQESPDQIAKSSAAVLPQIAAEIGARVPGGPDKPASAKALPEANLVTPHAVEYLTKEPLGLTGLGPTAIGYYKAGASDPAPGKRYRLVASAYADADQAKDAMKTLRTRPEALPVASVGDEGSAVMLKQGDKKVEYVFVRKGALIAGASDDDYAKDDHLTKDEKIAKLKAWLAAPAPSSASSAGAAVPKK